MRRRSLAPFKYLAYSLEMILLMALQATPKLMPQILGGMPLLLFSAALTFAAVEDAAPSLILGAVCGAVTDLISGNPVGYYAVSLTLICLGISLLLHTKLRATLFSLMVLSAAAVPLAIGLYFVLFRLIPGTPGAGTLFVSHYLARIGFTYVCIIPLYPLNKWLHRRLA